MRAWHGSGGVAHLVDRHPSVTPERLIAQLIPPPTFSDVSFDTYKPDPAEPSQAAAVQSCRQFCEQAVARRAGKKKLFGRREVLPGVGIYLDGGFGVGKTHLLASSYFDVPAPKAFATFGELTQLAGVFGFVECIDLLADYVVVCIDEFELDDPGNTTLISRLLSNWSSAGCRWRRRRTRCPSSWARAASPRRISCAKSTRWQAFSPRCGSTGRTTGIAIFRLRPNP